MATVTPHAVCWLHKSLEKWTKPPAVFSFLFSFFLWTCTTQSQKARLQEALCWRQEYGGVSAISRGQSSSPENIPNKTESWEVMKSFARADSRHQRQKALLTHPKPLNPRLWPLGARKCSNVGIKSQRADWCRYYAAGRLPRWGDTASEALVAPQTPALINNSVNKLCNERIAPQNIHFSSPTLHHSWWLTALSCTGSDLNTVCQPKLKTQKPKKQKCGIWSSYLLT